MVEYTDPSTLTPLFVAEYMTCGYPTSDVYGEPPRYLYYVLLGLVFVTQWHPWLANVFLGVAATYAGTAAIQAIILFSTIGGWLGNESTVSIPYIDPASVTGNETLGDIKNLVTGLTEVLVQPAAIDFDIDPVFAITVVGYLMMLPMHCWSSAVRANRIRHVLILFWNILMLAGVVCGFLVWVDSFATPLQYRFCYPLVVDSEEVTSEGLYADPVIQQSGDWNATLWNIFSNFTLYESLGGSCIYPCFNTTQVLRRPNSIAANLELEDSPRLNTQLFLSHVADPTTNIQHQIRLSFAALFVIIATTIIMLILLVLVLTPLRKILRVPIHKPKQMLRRSGDNEVFQALWQDFTYGITLVFTAISSPRSMLRKIQNRPQRTARRKAWKVFCVCLDIFAIFLLFIAMVVVPVAIIAIVVTIEWYIHRDLVTEDASQQVSQWTPPVSIGLILLSAIVLQFQYTIAGSKEIEDELAETHNHVEWLKALLEKKKEKEKEKERRKKRRKASIDDASEPVDQESLLELGLTTSPNMNKTGRETISYSSPADLNPDDYSTPKETPRA